MNHFDEIRVAIFNFMKERNARPERVQIPASWQEEIFKSPESSQFVTLEPKFGVVPHYAFSAMGYDFVIGPKFELQGEQAVKF